MKQIHISPLDLHYMINDLSCKILGGGKQYEMVVGVANGGLQISSCLSYLYGLPHKKITIRLRDDPHKGVDPQGEDWSSILTPFLWVDDIVDSGNTLRIFKDFGYIQGVDFDVAVLHWCKDASGDQRPDFYVSVKDPETWVIYPWEEQYEETT